MESTSNLLKWTERNKAMKLYDYTCTWTVSDYDSTAKCRTEGVRSGTVLWSNMLRAAPHSNCGTVELQLSGSVGTGLQSDNQISR